MYRVECEETEDIVGFADTLEEAVDLAKNNLTKGVTLVIIDKNGFGVQQFSQKE